MDIVDVIVDSHLRVPIGVLDEDLEEEICDTLTIPNSAYEIAEKMERWEYWKIEKEFKLWDYDDDHLILDRGCALWLKQYLRDYDYKVCWDDRRKWKRGKPYGPDEFEYRGHQPGAVDAIKKHQQGVYKSPTGSGKSVTILGFLWEKHPERALILVDKKHLVGQFIKLARKHLGKDVPIGRIGEGRWTEKRITVATVQSLWSAVKSDKIDQDWFDKWDAVFMDECHHTTAYSYNHLVSRFPARIRAGVSATPDKTGEWEVILGVLGEIFYETTHDELRELGLLVEPHVEVIHTDFEGVYWGDHTSDDDGDCEVPGCKKKEKHRHRNNYGDIKAQVREDPVRNAIIANNLVKVMHTGEHHQLVITSEVRHIELLEEALYEAWPEGDGGFDDLVYVVTGRSKEKRNKVLKEIEAADECIVLSTVAGEALDIPPLDRIHLVWPTSNPGTTTQNIGRGTRLTDMKDDMIVFDYADSKVKVLAKQFLKRRWQCYEPLGLEVNIND